jgi:hypothetical protein
MYNSKRQYKPTSAARYRLLIIQPVWVSTAKGFTYRRVCLVCCRSPDGSESGYEGVQRQFNCFTEAVSVLTASQSLNKQYIRTRPYIPSFSLLELRIRIL